MEKTPHSKKQEKTRKLQDFTSNGLNIDQVMNASLALYILPVLT